MNRSWISVVLLAVIAITATASAIYFISQGLVPKADIYYLHYVGYRWFQPQAAVEVILSFANEVPEEAFDIERRELSAFNYPVIALSSYFTEHLFPGNLPAAIGSSHALAFVAGLVIVLFALRKARPFVAPFALAVSAMAVLGFLPGPAPNDHLLRYGPLENMLNAVALTFAPGEAFSPLSFWPKSSLALIMLSALALRWHGRICAAYFALASTMLFHITLGAMVLGAFLIMDLLLRPRELPYRYVVPIFVVAAVALGAGQWQIFAYTGHIPLLFAAAAACAPFLVLASRKLSPVAARHRIVDADLVTILGVTVVLVPLLLVLYSLSYSGELWGPEASYVQIAARMIVLATAIFLFGLSVLATGWLERRQAGMAVLPVVVFACLAVSYGAAGSWWWEARFIAQRMAEPEVRPINEPVTQIYYKALRQLNGGDRARTGVTTLIP